MRRRSTNLDMSLACSSQHMRDHTSSKTDASIQHMPAVNAGIHTQLHEARHPDGRPMHALTRSTTTPLTPRSTLAGSYVAPSIQVLSLERRFRADQSHVEQLLRGGSLLAGMLQGAAAQAMYVATYACCCEDCAPKKFSVSLRCKPQRGSAMAAVIC